MKKIFSKKFSKFIALGLLAAQTTLIVPQNSLADDNGMAPANLNLFTTIMQPTDHTIINILYNGATPAQFRRKLTKATALFVLAGAAFAGLAFGALGAQMRLGTPPETGVADVTSAATAKFILLAEFNSNAQFSYDTEQDNAVAHDSESGPQLQARSLLGSAAGGMMYGNSIRRGGGSADCGQKCEGALIAWGASMSGMVSLGALYASAATLISPKTVAARSAIFFGSSLIIGGILTGFLAAEGALDNSNLIPPPPAPPAPSAPNPLAVNVTGVEFIAREQAGFSKAAISLNDQKEIVMKVLQIDNSWKQSELFRNGAGYGVYEYKMAISQPTSNVRSTFMLYQNDDQVFEMSLGQFGANNATFIVQPIDKNGNQASFVAIPGVDGFTQFRIEWTSQGILFNAYRDGQVVGSLNYTGANNFVPQSTKAVFKQWLIRSNAPNDTQEHSAKIKDFKFTEIK